MHPPRLCGVALGKLKEGENSVPMGRLKEGFTNNASFELVHEVDISTCPN
jgi:hypothetical protein